MLVLRESSFIFVKLIVSLAICYFFAGLFLANVGSPSSKYFYIQRQFSNWTGVNLFLNGMFAGRDNNITETRILFNFKDGTSITDLGRVYKWAYTRDPFIFTKSRLSNLQFVHLGDTFKEGLGRYYCNNDLKLFDKELLSILNQTHTFNLDDLLSQQTNYTNQHSEPDLNWTTRWQVICD